MLRSDLTSARMPFLTLIHSTGTTAPVLNDGLQVALRLCSCLDVLEKEPVRVSIKASLVDPAMLLIVASGVEERRDYDLS